MILYVNGDSHTAAAEAVNNHAFAMDDGELFYMGRAPHPDNLAASWGRLLSTALRAGFHCGAESASSNARIMRTTREWLSTQGYDQDLLLIIQWSTWEREEWYNDDDGQYYQVNASGIDHVPNKWHDRYKEFVANINWQQKTEQAHKEIWEFHQELNDQNIKHIFFNGNNDFSKVHQHHLWNMNYVSPYNPDRTFNALIQAQGIQTVAPNSWHFGRDGHSFFYRFMLQYIIDNNFI
jgi:hypothetical protein